MKENIKILEEKIKQFKAYKSNVYDIDFGEMMKRLILNGKEVQTLENLLTRYKQMAIENQSYKDYYGNPPCYDDAKYIPKSKVKEKIEELNKLIIETQKELGSASKEYTIYVHQENILQELLES